MKAPSPLLGFNNNVRHKGRMFHIQTEDSGIRHPHIITHLFADGGRILKTTKTSYAEHVGTPSMAETVRELMKEQHKAMFIALRDGQLDYLFDESAPRPPSASAPDAPRAAAPTIPDGALPRASSPTIPDVVPRGSAPTMPEIDLPRPTVPTLPDGTPSRKPAPSAPDVAAAPSAPAAVPRPNSAPPPPAAAPRPNSAPPPPAAAPRPNSAPPPPAAAPRPSSAPPPAAAGVETAGTVQVAEPMPASKRTSSRPRLELDPVALHALGLRPSPGALAGVATAALPQAPPRDSALARALRSPPPAAPRANPPEEPPSIDLDLDALERAASEAQTPFMHQIQDLPPPPASVMGRRTGGSAGTYSAVHAVHVPTPPLPTPPVAPAPLPSEQLGGGVGRYAPSRPSSIFATTRPAEGASIFGEDLISEKSLDEVILSYLAEDLDGPQEKK